MKKSALTLFITISIFFLTTITAYSFRNEQSGYNGFKWGMSYEDFLKSNKAKLKNKGGIYYGDKINGVNVDIGYDFYKNTLYGVKINFPEDERGKIIKYFKLLHGKPSLKRGKHLYWLGSETKIELKRKDVIIVDIKREKEYLNARKKKNRGKNH